MRLLSRLAVGLVAVALPASLSAQQVIDFEGLSSCTNYQSLPSVYAGMNWGGVSTIDPPNLVPFAMGKDALPGSGYQVGTNGCTSMFNWFAENPISMSRATTFSFNSFVATAAWSNQNMTVRGLLNGSLIFTHSVAINTQSQTLVNLNWTGINEVRWSGDRDHWVVDDINLNTNTVPEPGTMALLGTALAGLAARRRRKQQTS